MTPPVHVSTPVRIVLCAVLTALTLGFLPEFESGANLLPMLPKTGAAAVVGLGLLLWGIAFAAAAHTHLFLWFVLGGLRLTKTLFTASLAGGFLVLLFTVVALVVLLVAGAKLRDHLTRGFPRRLSQSRLSRRG